MGDHGAPTGPSHLLAASLSASGQPAVLKHADLFGVFDRLGDITPSGLGEEGLYQNDTRFLSAFRLEMNGARPFYLDSAVSHDNQILTVTLTNPDLVTPNGVRLPLATLHVTLKRFLWQGVMHQQSVITNHGCDRADVALAWHFGADYRDIFDVRALPHRNRGVDVEPVVSGGQVTLGYEGRDGVRRSTDLRFDPEPSRLSGVAAGYDLRLEPHERVTLTMRVTCSHRHRASASLSFQAAQDAVAVDVAHRQTGHCRLETSHGQMNGWIDRAVADLRTLTTELPTGAYPYAGIPWFNTPFGRDGLITAWQCLWLQPALARGVLGFLAQTQATEVDTTRDAEPGKILHETRSGELAAIGEIPFDRYYGSADGTPLFVALAGAYFERTGDVAFARTIWPFVDRALAWIVRDGDRDGDGFVEYARASDAGLLHQGWKDSDDAIMHSDGSLAHGPIAVCEIQAYVHAAWRGAAVLARALREPARAESFEAHATTLRARFDKAFWCEELGTYALALDGDKKPCRVRASNAGHCLFGGIVEPRRAPMLARTLVGSACFSGWGVRTLGSVEARFNPMGYHTGGVWPHDNALIADGLSAYGFTGDALSILLGQFEASLHFDLQRMPELFCGFDRQPGEAPVPYPLACAPQAWASGAVLLLIKASLGLHVDALQRRVTFRNPRLPPWLDQLSILGLDVAGSIVDLSVVRLKNRLSVSLLRNDGSVQIVLR